MNVNANGMDDNRIVSWVSVKRCSEVIRNMVSWNVACLCEMSVDWVDSLDRRDGGERLREFSS